MGWIIFLFLALGGASLGYGLYLEHKIEANGGVWRGRYMGDADFDQIMGGFLLAIGVILEALVIIFHVLRAIWLGVI